MIIRNNNELRELTGSWYASNDFDRIKMDIELETEELAKIVGDEVIDLVSTIATKGVSASADESKLLRHVQLPIAIMATYRFYQSNIVSHDQSSRKIKVDKDNETLPWEWMLDRDDAAHLSKAQRAVDRLIAYLDKVNPDEWENSPNKKATRKLFVNNTDVFGDYYPIDNSARFYYLALPLLREVQVTKIKDALDTDYKPLLDAFQNNDLSEHQEELLEYTRRAQVLATIALAVRRLNTKVLPDSIVKALKSQSHTTNATRPATVDEINYFSRRIEQDAFEFIDKIKRKRHENDPDKLEYQLLPKNNPENKFART